MNGPKRGGFGGGFGKPAESPGNPAMPNDAYDPADRVNEAETPPPAEEIPVAAKGRRKYAEKSEVSDDKGGEA